MNVKFLPLTSLLLSTALPAITTTWIGGGDTTDFGDATNWDNGVPAFGDIAIFGGFADGSTIPYELDIDIGTLNITSAGDGGPIFDGTSSVFFTDGTAVGGGFTSTTAGAQVNIDNTFEITGTAGFSFFNREVNSSGTLLLSGTNEVSLTDSTLNNYGDIRLTNNASLFNGGNGALFNQGKLRNESTNEVGVGWDTQNDAFVIAQNGNIKFTGPYTQSSLAFAIVENSNSILFNNNTQINGGNLMGQGSFNNLTGSPLNVLGGYIEPEADPEEVIFNGGTPTPALLQFEGDWTFGSGTTFFVDIFGAGTGEYDEINFLGTADLSTMPSLYLHGPANLVDQLTSADLIDIIAAEQINGTFFDFPDGSKIQISDLDTGDKLGDFTISYIDDPLVDMVRLSDFEPVPEPSTYALMGLGAAVIGFWARRRLVKKAS